MGTCAAVTVPPHPCTRADVLIPPSTSPSPLPAQSSPQERAALFVGPLVTMMVQRMPDLVAPLLPQVCHAVALRMRAASVPMVLTALVRVFPSLVLTNPAGLCDLLQGIPMEGSAPEEGTSALVYVMRQWTQWAGEINGAFAIKESTAAMAALLASGHPALSAVSVRGKEIETTQGIRTRSKAKAAGGEARFEEVPLAAKLLSLIADALLEAEEADAAQWVEDGEGEGGSDSDGAPLLPLLLHVCWGSFLRSPLLALLSPRPSPLLWLHCT